MPHLDINGVTLNYQVHGRGTPLLFLHGLGSSLMDWDFQVAAFKEQFQVITCDLRGHGDSSKSRGDYSIQLFANDVVGLIRELTEQPVHVVGLSLGGMVAIELALNHPDCIKTITLVNCLPNVVVRPMTLIKRWFVLHVLGMKAMATILANPLLPGPERAELRKDLINRWQKNDRRAYTASAHAILNWSAAERLDQLNLPVAILASEFDYWSLDLKKRLFAPVPHAEFVEIPRAHHIPCLEFPDEFNRILRDILLKNM